MAAAGLGVGDDLDEVRDALLNPSARQQSPFVYFLSGGHYRSRRSSDGEDTSEYSSDSDEESVEENEEKPKTKVRQPFNRE